MLLYTFFLCVFSAFSSSVLTLCYLTQIPWYFCIVHKQMTCFLVENMQRFLLHSVINSKTALSNGPCTTTYICIHIDSSFFSFLLNFCTFLLFDVDTLLGTKKTGALTDFLTDYCDTLSIVTGSQLYCPADTHVEHNCGKLCDCMSYDNRPCELNNKEICWEIFDFCLYHCHRSAWTITCVRTSSNMEIQSCSIRQMANRTHTTHAYTCTIEALPLFTVPTAFANNIILFLTHANKQLFPLVRFH